MTVKLPEPVEAAAPTEPPRIRLEAVKAKAAVLVQIAELLDPLSREDQLRVLESTCVILGDDDFADRFREARRGKP